MIDGAPAFDRNDYAPETRAVAARAWQRLLVQEDRSRAATAGVASDLGKLDAPAALIDWARRIEDEEARHVAICEHVVQALGFVPQRPPLPGWDTPTDGALFAQVVTERLVAGFAVAETMSVGGFAASRSRAREPLARWALGEVLRDEVGHGAFGEVAGAWAMREWHPETRRAMWPRCVAAMEAIERRTGGPVGSQVVRACDPSVEALGAAGSWVVGAGMLRSVPRAVLPRLTRMGILPALPDPL
jgi:hypothetical protein